MSSASDPSDPSHALLPGLLSRRRALQLSGAGLAAGALAGCALPGTGQAAAQDAWSMTSLPSQRGRRALVTGGNGYPQDGRSGLGYHAALNLARAGAEVTIASRRQDRGDEAVRRIREAVPGALIGFERLDLADLASVAAFVARQQTSGRPLDLLVNNAGVMGRRNREVSADGFERVLATNAIGPYALTAGLLPLLRQGQNPRIVWVGSMRMSRQIGFDDLQMEREYDYALAYDRSKLAVLMLAMEMQRRATTEGWGVPSLAAHPGVARTNLIPDGPGMDSPEGLRLRGMALMFRDPAEMVSSMLYAATASEVTGGAYYGPGGVGNMGGGSPRLVDTPEAALDPDAATLWWSTLQRLTRVSVT